MSKHQLLWWSLVVAGGLVGGTAAVNSSSVLSTAIVFAVTAPILGLLFTTLRSLDSNGERVRPFTATTVVTSGAIAGFMLVAFYGLTDLIGTGVFPLIVLLALTSPMVMDRWRTRPARSNPHN